MSNVKEYAWATTQSIQMGGATANAIAPVLTQYRPSELLRRVQGNAELFASVMQRAVAMFMSCFQLPFLYDKTKAGWELVRLVVHESGYPAHPVVDESATGPVVPDWDSTQISDLLEMAPYVRGVDGLDGQLLAEWLLDLQQYIPRDWDGHYLVFPGTLWRRRDGQLFVPVLYQYCKNGAEIVWMLDFRPIEEVNTHQAYRVLRRRTTSVDH